MFTFGGNETYRSFYIPACVHLAIAGLGISIWLLLGTYIWPCIVWLPYLRCGARSGFCLPKFCKAKLAHVCDHQSVQ